MLDCNLTYDEYTEFLETVEMTLFDVLVKYGCPTQTFEEALVDFYLTGLDEQYDQTVVFWHINAHTEVNVLNFLSRIVDVSNPEVFPLIEKHVTKLDWARLTEHVVYMCCEEYTVNDSVAQFCSLFDKYIVWDDLCKHMGLFREYETLWTVHENKIVWDAFCNADADMAIKYQSRLDWAQLCAENYSLFNEMDDEQFAAVEHCVNWVELSKNKFLSYEFIEKHFPQLDHKTMFEYQVRFPRAKYFARNTHLVKLEVIKYISARELADILYEIRKRETMYKVVDTCNDFTCPICRADDTAGVVEIRCRHRFHRECIDQWLDSVPSCPMCRSAI